MLLQMEGFDHYGAGNLHTSSTVMSQYFVNNGYTLPTGTSITNTSYGKTAGSLGVRMYASTNASLVWIEKPIRPDQYKGALPWQHTDKVVLGFAFRIVIAPTGRLMFARIGGFELGVGSDWQLYVGAGGEVQTGYSVELNIWNYCEIEINTTDNKARLYMNDYLAYEGDLAEGATLDKFELRSFYATGGTANHQVIDVDDLYLIDGSGEINNQRLGKVQVLTRYPKADAETAWNRSGGLANYLNVNEATPNGDTNFVSSNVPGATDFYQNTDIFETIDDAAICGVAVVPYARMVEPDSLAITAVVESDGVVAEGERMKLKAASYTAEKNIFELDPA